MHCICRSSPPLNKGSISALTVLSMNGGRTTKATSPFQAIRYLYSTRMDGLYYWRTRPRTDLPESPLPTINSNAQDLLLNDRPEHEASIAVAYANYDWATCVKTRCSFSGICIQLAQNSNLPSPSPPRKLSLWQPETLAECRDLSAASSGTLIFHRRPPQLPMKTTTGAQPWPTPKNVPPERAISTSSTLPYVTGLSATLSILNELIPRST